MNRTLLALLSLPLLSPAAHAVDVGTSYGVGVVDNIIGAPLYPSLDLYFDGAVLQTYPLEFISFLTDDILYLGANLYMPVVAQPGPGGWQRVVQPGGSLDLVLDPTALGLMAASRFGLEHEAGAGVYIVPAIGVAYANEDADLAAEGRIEFSVWFDGAQ